MVGQPQDHPGQDAIVKEKRPACALELPEPGIIWTRPVGNVPRQQFSSHQSLSHTSAGDGIEESCGIAKQHKPGCHARAGLRRQGRGCEHGGYLLSSLQAFGQFWLRKQPAVEGPLDRFTELSCICQHGNKHFTLGQWGHVELVTRSEKHIDTRSLSLSLRKPEMRSNSESL